MSHKKKGASHYDKAVTRLAALKSIDEKMDLGNGLSIEVYEEAIKDLRHKLDTYNTTLSNVDEQLMLVRSSEKILMDLSERMLSGIVTRYSKNSNEYVKAGGVKKSEIKKGRSPIKKEAA